MPLSNQVTWTAPEARVSILSSTISSKYSDVFAYSSLEKICNLKSSTLVNGASTFKDKLNLVSVV